MDKTLNTQDNQGGRRDTPGNQLTIRLGRNWVTEHTGSKKHNKTVHTPNMTPPPGRCVLAPQKHPKGRGGWELWGRLRRRTDTREGAGRQRPGRRRRREEPGKRQEGPGAGGAWRDPGHSHNGSPRWSRRREEPWRRNGRWLQGADQRWRSRWRRCPRRRAEEQGRRGGSGGPRRSRWHRRPRRRWGSRWPRWSRSNRGLRRSLTEPEGRRDEAQPEEWSPEAQDGRRQTKVELEG